ncbi:WD40-repeat-containing domain protein [Baffinella frigidus]|nr:WD40-repeat-containing domain protein [Cryptophyta sp. CCMP2293]
MPRLPLNEFSNQKKIIFSLFFEFLNLKNIENLIIFQNFLYKDSLDILGYIVLNQLFLLIVNRNVWVNVKLCNFENNNLSYLNVSRSGTCLCVINERNIIYFLKLIKFNKNNSHSKKKNYFMKPNLILRPKFLDLKKILLILIEESESYFLISFKTKKILIFSLKSCRKLLIETNFLICNIKFLGLKKSKMNLMYKSKEDILFFVEIKKCKIKKFFKIKDCAIASYFFTMKNSNFIEFLCICHCKCIKKKFLPNKIDQLFISKNIKIYGFSKKIFVKLNIKNMIFLECENHHYNLSQNNKNAIKFIAQKTKFLTKASSNLLILDWCILKRNPLSEKELIITNYPIKINNFEKINDIKFFGYKLNIAIASELNSIRIFSGSDFKFNNEYIFGESEFLKIEFLGPILIGMNLKGQMVFWDTKSGDVLDWFFPNNGKPCLFSVEKKKKGVFFIFGNKAGVIKIWELIFIEDKKIIKKNTITKNFYAGQIIAISISTEANYVAFSNIKKEIFLWNFFDKNEIKKLKKTKKCAWFLVFSPKSKILVAGIADGTILIFNVNRGIIIKKLVGENSPFLNCIFFKNSPFLLCTNGSGSLSFWNLQRGLCLNSIKNHRNKLWACDVFKSNKWVVTGCTKGKIILLKNCDRENSDKKFIEFDNFFSLYSCLKESFSRNKLTYLFEKLIFFRDPILTKDFIFYFFEKYPKCTRKNPIKFFKNLDNFSIKFIFKAMLIWGQKNEGEILVQKLLYSIIRFDYSFVFRVINIKILKLLHHKINSWKKNFEIKIRNFYSDEIE